ncbi:MAG: hypothetical protein A2156_05945 [Deltaproteobacteria bacterium RBG_16_48_10]|nr:MAG: hypothetical protein A2156_05945 [Deltaproteobacteria bacterium RBG_16_48_10]
MKATGFHHPRRGRQVQDEVRGDKERRPRSSGQAELWPDVDQACFSIWDFKNVQGGFKKIQKKRAKQNSALFSKPLG